MGLLKSKKTFPFRGYKGRAPTTEEIRAEVEDLYKYLVTQIDDCLVVSTASTDVHDEVVSCEGEVVFADGDAVMVNNVPND